MVKCQSGWLSVSQEKFSTSKFQSFREIFYVIMMSLNDVILIFSEKRNDDRARDT